MSQGEKVAACGGVSDGGRSWQEGNDLCLYKRGRMFQTLSSILLIVGFLGESTYAERNRLVKSPGSGSFEQV